MAGLQWLNRHAIYRNGYIGNHLENIHIHTVSTSSTQTSFAFTKQVTGHVAMHTKRKTIKDHPKEKHERFCSCYGD